MGWRQFTDLAGKTLMQRPEEVSELYDPEDRRRERRQKRQAEQPAGENPIDE
jgi:hypothetical protein